MANGTRIKVLVVDDEKLVRFTISAYLKTSGFIVTEAASPAEAIGAFKRDQFHVVVSDISMGDMDGFMLRDAIRAIAPEVPIIFLTAMVNDAGNTFMSKVMEDIRSYYVAKSSPRSVLIAKINQVVKASLAEQNVRRLESSLEKSMSLASFVQRAMLPLWTHITDTYTYTCCWEPYGGISGDLFEWYPITKDSALVVIGDISGHGTTAALAMTAVQAYLKQFAHIEDRKARHVEAITRRIHEFIIQNLKDVIYMVTTVIYVNTAEGTVRYLNCGNPEPFFYRHSSGTRERLNPDNLGGLPPGLVADAEYRAEDVIEFRFGEGDVLIVTTDGLFDLTSDEAGLEPPPQELMDELHEVAVKTQDGDFSVTSAIPYRVMNALNDMGYTHLQDDTMFFCLTRNYACSLDERVFEVNMQPTDIDEACRQCGEYAAKLSGDPDFGVKIDLLLNEHLMNVYRHGYDDFGKQHEVSLLAIKKKGDSVVIGVWDRGAEWKDVVQETEAEAEAALDARNDMLSGGGRGRAIMRKIADEIKSERFMNLNKTVFTVKVKGK